MNKLRKLLDIYPNWCYAHFGSKKGFLIAMIPIWALLVGYMLLIFSGAFGG